MSTFCASGLSKSECPKVKEQEQEQEHQSGDHELHYDVVRALPNAKDRPKGLYMLSNLDQPFPLPFDILFAFQTNSSLVNVDVGPILKQSLSKALEVYYPLAGRVKVGFGGKMVVDCDIDGGVPSAEVFSNEDMPADIAMIDRKLAKKLVYNNQTPYVTGLDVPPLSFQVNRFRCGGMILGLRFNHVIFDGIGFTNFMKSWSEIARDLPFSIKPHLERCILSPRKPPKVHFGHPEFSRSEKPLCPPVPHTREKIIINKSFIFTPTMLSRLRELGVDQDKNEPVSTFEVISALTWRCWSKANKLGPDETTRIGILVDGRSKLQPPVPKGFFGNCVVVACVQSKARDLTSQPLSYALGTVHGVLKTMTGDYIRSVIDFHEITRKPLDRDNVVWMTKWTRIPFYEIDFGWGVASQVAPGTTFENYSVIFSHGKDNKNIVLSLTLPIHAMEIFQDLITSQLNYA